MKNTNSTKSIYTATHISYPIKFWQLALGISVRNNYLHKLTLMKKIFCVFVYGLFAIKTWSKRRKVRMMEVL
jgi:uncharacterized phage infection (PIP) family protein YhgE